MQARASIRGRHAQVDALHCTLLHAAPSWTRTYLHVNWAHLPPIGLRGMVAVSTVADHNH